VSLVPGGPNQFFKTFSGKKQLVNPTREWKFYEFFGRTSLAGKRHRFVYKRMRQRYELPERKSLERTALIPKGYDADKAKRLYEIPLAEGLYEAWKSERHKINKTVIHIIGMEKDPSGEELSRIVLDTLCKVREKALPLRPPCPSGPSVCKFTGNPDMYLKGFRPTTMESGRRMLDYMGALYEYLHGVRPSPWKINEYIKSALT